MHRVTPCCSSAISHLAQQSQGKGKKVCIFTCVIFVSPACPRVATGSCGWQQSWKSGSDRVTEKGFGFSSPFLLNRGYSKGKRFGSQKQIEPNTLLHTQPLSTAAEGPAFRENQTFPTNLSLEWLVFWLQKSFHNYILETMLPCPFSFCVVMDFCKTYLPGDLIRYNSLGLLIQMQNWCVLSVTLYQTA